MKREQHQQESESSRHTFVMSGQTPPPPQINRRTFLLSSATTVAAFSATAALVSACGSSGPASSSDPVTITIMNESVTPAIVKDFQAHHPKIKVNVLKYDQQRLSASLAAGSPPDLVRTPGAPEIPNFAARGLAQSLDAYFSTSTLLKVDDLMPICDVYRWDGQKQGQGARYGMPNDWSFDSMYWYDAAVFANAKVTPPSATTPVTFEQWLDLGKQLTVHDNKGAFQRYGLDIGFYYVPYAGLITMLNQQGLELFNSDMTQANFKQPEVRKIFQWIVDWAQAHVGPSPLNPTNAWAGDLFPAHREGMVGYGYWFGSFVDSTAKANVSLAPTPLWGTQRIATCFGGTGMWMPKAAKHQDEAWQFFEYFMGGKPAHDRAVSGSGIPALKSLQSLLPQTTPSQKAAYQALQNELPYFKVLHFTPYAPENAITSVIDTNLQQVMKGQNSLDNAINTIDSTVSLLLQQGKSLIG